MIRIVIGVDGSVLSIASGPQTVGALASMLAAEHASKIQLVSDVGEALAPVAVIDTACTLFALLNPRLVPTILIPRPEGPTSVVKTTDAERTDNCRRSHDVMGKLLQSHMSILTKEGGTAKERVERLREKVAEFREKLKQNREELQKLHLCDNPKRSILDFVSQHLADAEDTVDTTEGRLQQTANEIEELRRSCDAFVAEDLSSNAARYRKLKSQIRLIESLRLDLSRTTAASKAADRAILAKFSNIDGLPSAFQQSNELARKRLVWFNFATKVHRLAEVRRLAVEEAINQLWATHQGGLVFDALPAMQKLPSWAAPADAVAAHLAAQSEALWTIENKNIKEEADRLLSETFLPSTPTESPKSSAEDFSKKEQQYKEKIADLESNLKDLQAAIDRATAKSAKPRSSSALELSDLGDFLDWKGVREKYMSKPGTTGAGYQDFVFQTLCQPERSEPALFNFVCDKSKNQFVHQTSPDSRGIKFIAKTDETTRTKLLQFLEQSSHDARNQRVIKGSIVLMVGEPKPNTFLCEVAFQTR